MGEFLFEGTCHAYIWDCHDPNRGRSNPGTDKLANTLKLSVDAAGIAPGERTIGKDSYP